MLIPYLKPKIGRIRLRGNIVKSFPSGHSSTAAVSIAYLLIANGNNKEGLPLCKIWVIFRKKKNTPESYDE
ncbi:MAG: hypothetical protein CMO81_01130 [Waddliaceae bacterium]|nr:hypothetical protein [Waddliaceae bacterium]